MVTSPLQILSDRKVPPYACLLLVGQPGQENWVNIWQGRAWSSQPCCVIHSAVGVKWNIFPIYEKIEWISKQVQSVNDALSGNIQKPASEVSGRFPASVWQICKVTGDSSTIGCIRSNLLEGWNYQWICLFLETCQKSQRPVSRGFQTICHWWTTRYVHNHKILVFKEMILHTNYDIIDTCTMYN